jgi:tRNA wybutosine-synthesizing protein 2
MSFYKLLRKELEEKLPPQLLEVLPRSYEMLGKVLLLKLRPELESYKHEIGEAILKILPVKTVCLLKGIAGETRKPVVEVIAGDKNTETVHREHGCVYKLDAAKHMFSKGNKAERIRLPKLVKQGEIIVDMFAGIGYFTIPLAKYSSAKKIYAIDINPEAVEYLKENLRLNKIPEEKVEVICGDCREIVTKLSEEGIKADRIIMGFPFKPENFLSYALKLAKKGTIIHYHFNATHEELESKLKAVEKIFQESGFNLNILLLKKVKSYAPRVYHWVADIQVV